MTPDEKEPEIVDDEFSGDGKPESHLEESDFIDIEEATGAEDFSADDDVSEDDDFDLNFDEKKKSKGGGLKKMIIPLLLLGIAGGVGATIVANPSLLGGGAMRPAAPAPQTAASDFPDANAPVMPTETTAMPPPMPEGDLAAEVDAKMPQPPAAVNEAAAPAAPPVAVPVTPPASDSAAAPSMPGDMPEDSVAIPNDLTAPIAPAAEMAAIEEKPAVAIKKPEAPVAPEKPQSMKAPEKKDGAPAAAAAKPEAAPIVTPEEEMPEPVMEVAQAEPPAMPDLPKKIPVKAPEPVQGTVTAMPETAPPPVAAGPALTAPEGMDSAPASVTGTAAAPGQPATPDNGGTYYDADQQLPVPTGPLATNVVPRKVSPDMEPASKFVVVEGTQAADSMEAQIVAANRGLKLGMYDSAFGMFDDLYKKNPRDPRILMGRAVALQNLGRTDAALQAYDELLGVDPGNSDALVNMLGVLRTEYPEVALRRLLDLHDKYPNNAAIVAQIGVTQASLKHTDDAMKYLGMASSMEPNNAQHLFNMAVVSDRAGNKKQAVFYYEKALEVDVVYGGGRSVPRDQIYDRLSTLHGQ